MGLKKKALDMYLSDIENSDLPSESKLVAVLNAKQTIKKLRNGDQFQVLKTHIDVKGTSGICQ